jgi:hypothetical protein
MACYIYKDALLIYNYLFKAIQNEKDHNESNGIHVLRAKDFRCDVEKVDTFAVHGKTGHDS